MPPISDEDIVRLKEIFVTRKECDETTDGIREEQHKSSKDIEVIKYQCKMILGILSAIGVAVLSLVVKQFWGV